LNVVVKDFPDEDWRMFKAKAAERGLTIRDALVIAAREWRSEFPSLTRVTEAKK